MKGMYPRINDILLDLDFEYILIFYILNKPIRMLIMNLGHNNREYLIFGLTRGEHDAAAVLIYYGFQLKHPSNIMWVDFRP